MAVAMVTKYTLKNLLFLDVGQKVFTQNHKFRNTDNSVQSSGRISPNGHHFMIHFSSCGPFMFPWQPPFGHSNVEDSVNAIEMSIKY